MPRLIACGCSHTYGESLPGCLTTKRIDDPQPPPSQFAWPHVLAEKLGIEYLNRAHGGASNKQISTQMLSTELNKDDIVVFLWTHHDRSCFFDIQNGKFWIDQLVPSYTEKRKNNPKDRRIKNQVYYKYLHTEINSIHETFLYIDHSYKHLESLGIKNFHFTFDRKDEWPGRHENMSSKLGELEHWFTAPVHNIDLLMDTGADGFHPGVSAQADMAEKMLKIIEANND